MTRITTFVFTYNDEKMIPYTMRHYTKFSRVIIVDNGSDDRTVELACSLGASGVIYSQMRDELNDIRLAEMKSLCWKGIDADWVIVCDADEFVYHPDLVEVLNRTNATIVEPKWGEMFSEKFPTTDGQIYDEIKTGIIGGGFKNNLFKPKEIQEINYGVGCHTCQPKGNIILFVNSGIMTLHMKNLSKQHLLDKTSQGMKRQSEVNKRHGFSIQFHKSEAEVSQYFDTYLSASTQLIP